MANSYKIIKYRDKITNTLLSSPALSDYCGFSSDNADTLLWKRFIPQQYLPNISTENGTYIFYDVETDVNPQKKVKTTFNEITFYFWVISYKDSDWVKYKPVNSTYQQYTNLLRNDLICWELENLFKDKNTFGIGQIRFYGNKLFNASDNNLTGRLLTFKVTDRDRN